MGEKKMEIKQIAEALSLSSTTVSRALSGKGRVSQETKERIAAYIEEHAVVPTVHHAAYTEKKTKNILVTVAGESNYGLLPYFSQVIISAYDYFQPLGYQVMIVETAFPYTDESHDDMPNVVTGELTRETMNLLPSVSNQRAVTRQVIDMVRGAENGSGVFYWEPVWYQVKGVGVSRGKGNEWENQAMFDADGHALESICAFEG